MPVPETRRPLEERDAIRAPSVRVHLERGRVAQEQVDADPVDGRAHWEALVVWVVWGRSDNVAVEAQNLLLNVGARVRKAAALVVGDGCGGERGRDGGLTMHGRLLVGRRS